MPLRSRLSILVSVAVPVLVHAQFGSPGHLAHQQIASGGSYIEWQCLTHCDLDDDGLMDILTLGDFSTLGGVAWLKNNGDGTYGNPNPIGPGFKNVAAMDVNGDGRVDVITCIAGTWPTPGRLGYYLNQGFGLFSPAITIFDQINSVSTSNECVLRTGDIDNDGDDDLLVAFYGASGGDRRLWWYRNNGPAGLSASININGTELLSNLTSIEIADMDGDGDNDILYSRSGVMSERVAYLRNSGTATFQSMLTVTSVMLEPISTALGVINGEPGMMVAVGMATNTSVRIYRLNSQGTLIDSSSVSLSLVPHALCFADVNGDGYADLVVSNRAASETFMYYSSGTNGLSFLSTPDRLPFGSASALAEIQGPTTNLIRLCANAIVKDTFGTNWNTDLLVDVVGATGWPGTDQLIAIDLNGDSLLDIMTVIGKTAIWYENLGGLQFRRAAIIDGLDFPPMRLIAHVDLNGDSEKDIVAYATGSNQSNPDVVTMQRTGTNFSPPQTLMPANSGRNVVVADFDEDGDTDLVILATNGFYLRLNNGGGTFSSAYTQYSNLRNIHAIDWDSDGLSDLLAATTSGTFMWFRNLGAGNFSSPFSIAASAYSTSLSDREFVDVDGDGLVDYLICGGISQPAFWRRNLGLSSFGAPIELPVGTNTGAFTQSRTKPFADMNGDGLLDLCRHHVNLEYFAATAPGVFSSTSTVVSGTGNFFWAFDFDNDGDMDVVTRSIQSAPNNEPFSILRLIEGFASNCAIAGVVYVDLDGDGIQDLNEPGSPGLNVILDPVQFQTTTSSTGEFMAYANSGSYTLQASGSWSPQLWTLTQGASGYAFEVANQEEVSGFAFGLTPTSFASSISATISTGTGACGTDIPLWVSLHNEGTQIEQGLVSLQLDSRYEFVGASFSPISVNDNLVVWSFDSLSYFETQVFSLTVTSPLPQFVGDTIFHAATIESIGANNEIIAQFNTESEYVLACSYDPNDKQSEPLGYGFAGAVELPIESFDYTIRFQNTGTGPAYRVELRDDLSDYFNTASFQVVGYSHYPNSIEINEAGRLRIVFDPILLSDSASDPIASQGFIRFRLHLLPGLEHLTVVQNRAEIYFDLNPPISTNTTTNALVDCGLWTPTAALVQEFAIIATEGDHYQWYLNGELLPGSSEQVHLLDALGSYAAAVTSEYGCVAMTEPIQVIALSAPGIRSSHMTIMPNPSTGDAILRLTQPIHAAFRVEVRDVHGRLLRTMLCEASTTLQLSRGSLDSGLYFVQLVHGGQVFSCVRWLVH